MLLRQQDIRLKSARGFYAHKLAIPSSSRPPAPPSFLLTPPTWTLPFSITHRYTSFGHSLLFIDRPCLSFCVYVCSLSYCLSRKVHPFNQRSAQGQTRFHITASIAKDVFSRPPLLTRIHAPVDILQWSLQSDLVSFDYLSVWFLFKWLHSELFSQFNY